MIANIWINKINTILINKINDSIFQSTIFWSIIFCSNIFCSTIFWSIIFCSNIFCSTIFWSSIFRSTIFRSTNPISFPSLKSRSCWRRWNESVTLEDFSTKIVWRPATMLWSSFPLFESSYNVQPKFRLRCRKFNFSTGIPL